MINRNRPRVEQTILQRPIPRSKQPGSGYAFETASTRGPRLPVLWNRLFRSRPCRQPFRLPHGDLLGVRRRDGGMARQSSILSAQTVAARSASACRRNCGGCSGSNKAGTARGFKAQPAPKARDAAKRRPFCCCYQNAATRPKLASNIVPAMMPTIQV
jgi:hypothetical protein